MIKLNNVCFSYKKSKEQNILLSINYEFLKGNIYLLSGRNGVGKTTLINLILGFLKPTSGELTVDKKLTISYLPDYNGLYEDLSVIDNIYFRLSMYGVKFIEKQNLLLDLLKSNNLQGKENELVMNLSLGMKKKVAFICTMIIEPDIYILDEPTGGVDEQSKMEIASIINYIISDNNMILCISHDRIILDNVHAIQLSLEEGNLHVLPI